MFSEGFLVSKVFSFLKTASKLVIRNMPNVISAANVASHSQRTSGLHPMPLCWCCSWTVVINVGPRSTLQGTDHIVVMS